MQVISSSRPTIGKKAPKAGRVLRPTSLQGTDTTSRGSKRLGSGPTVATSVPPSHPGLFGPPGATEERGGTDAGEALLAEHRGRRGWVTCPWSTREQRQGRPGAERRRGHMSSAGPRFLGTVCSPGHRTYLRQRGGQREVGESQREVGGRRGGAAGWRPHTFQVGEVRVRVSRGRGGRPGRTAHAAGACELSQGAGTRQGSRTAGVRAPGLQSREVGWAPLRPRGSQSWDAGHQKHLFHDAPDTSSHCREGGGTLCCRRRGLWFPVWPVVTSTKGGDRD